MEGYYSITVKTEGKTITIKTHDVDTMRATVDRFIANSEMISVKCICW